MSKAFLPKALWWPLAAYLIGWIALFALIALRLELIAPLIEYRKLVYLFGLAVWHVLVLTVVTNQQAGRYLEARLRRRQPLPAAGLLFGLVLVDLGLFYVLTT